MTCTRHDPDLPVARVNLVKAGAPVTGRVVASTLCMNGKSASYVRHVAIDISETPLAGAILPGQSVGVIVPGTDRDGKAHKTRLYSVSSPGCGEDGQGQVIAITVKREIDEREAREGAGASRERALGVGVCSNHVCDLVPGDPIQLSGPSGKRFLLPEDPAGHDFLWVAVGTGVAPFRAMAMELLEGRGGVHQGEIHLVVGSPYSTDLLYHEQFTAMAREHEGFHYHVALSRETAAGASGPRYVHQLLEDRIETLRPMLLRPGTLFYMCGLTVMQGGLYHVLHTHDLGPSYIRVDEELAALSRPEWTASRVSRHLRPTPRTLCEVY